MALGGTVPLIMKKAAGAAAGAAITKSVRFNNPDSPELRFTPSSTGNQKMWTTAFWFKRGKLSYNSCHLFGAESHSGNNGIAAFYYESDDKLFTYFDSSGTAPVGTINDRVYRDPAGWMQIIWAVDAANTTQRFWINGVEETVASANDPPDYAYAMNLSGFVMALGVRPWDAATHWFDGYYAQFVHLDGQYITDPTEFGQFSSTSGEWEPIEITSSSFTYGTNGALLEFLQTGTSADADGIGADTSGEDNHWSVTNLAATDIVNDTPASNHAVLNGLDHSGGTTLTEGNLEYDTSDWNEIRGTMGVSSGKWYYEVYVDNFDDSSEAFSVGIAEVNGAIQSTYWSASWDNAANGRRYGVNLNSTTVSKIEGGTATTITADIVDGDVISILLDLDSGTTTLKFWVNGADEQTLFSSLAAGTYAIGFNSYTASLILNTGQDPTFAGNDPVGSPATSEFAYTPTSGYNGWSTSNLPTPTIAKPSDYFSATTYSGADSTAQSITTGLEPDLLWIKNRGSSSMYHQLFDDVRGLSGGALVSNDDALQDSVARIASFTSTGFTTPTTDYSYTDDGGETYVAWSWKKSVAAGFDIVEYEASAYSSDVALTSGFGTPEMVIVKVFDNNSYSAMMSYFDDWIVWHKDTTDEGYYLVLNDDAGQTNSPGGPPPPAPPTDDVINVSDETITVGGSPTAGPYLREYDMSNGRKYIVYAFKSIEGFSKVGSYTGDANDFGPFISLGFRPAYILIKNITSSGEWYAIDTGLNPFNLGDAFLHPNLDVIQVDSGVLDFVSNGFKIRNNGPTGGYNASGDTIIFYAVAESPQKYANAR